MLSYLGVNKYGAIKLPSDKSFALTRLIYGANRHRGPSVPERRARYSAPKLCSVQAAALSNQPAKFLGVTSFLTGRVDTD
jgi:hypothetical protein